MWLWQKSSIYYVYLKPRTSPFCAGKPAKKEPSIKKKVAAEGKGSGKGGKSATANNSAAGEGKARTPSGNRKHQAPQPDRNELLKSLMWKEHSNQS